MLEIINVLKNTSGKGDVIATGGVIMGKYFLGNFTCYQCDKVDFDDRGLQTPARIVEIKDFILKQFSLIKD